MHTQRQMETVELKNSMSEIKNAVESVNSNLNQAEKIICELEYRSFNEI